MDPNANIARQRALASEILTLSDSLGAADDADNSYELAAHDEAAADTRETIAERAVELAEHVQALDEWRSRGGFDPYAAATEASSPHGNVPDGAERAAFNSDATKSLFGTPVITPAGTPGHIVAVDVRDQFGLGDDVWLVQTAAFVAAYVATYCRPDDTSSIEADPDAAQGRGL